MPSSRKSVSRARRHVWVFTMQQGHVAIENRNFATEAAHCLGKLKTDVAAAQNDQVRGELLQFQRLDVCEGFCAFESRD